MKQAGTARTEVKHLQDELTKLEVVHKYAQVVERDRCEWVGETEKKLLEQLRKSLLVAFQIMAVTVVST